MKYEHIKEESREYKYGPGEEFETEFEAKRHVSKLKNTILTNLILEGLRTSIEEINVIKVDSKNAFKLTTVIKYPKNIFEEQEER